MDDSTYATERKRYLTRELALVLDEARIFQAMHADEPEASDVVLVAGILASGQLPTTPDDLLVLLFLHRHAIERGRPTQRTPHHA